MINKDLYTLLLIVTGLVSFLILRPVYALAMLAVRLVIFVALSGTLYWLLTHSPTL